MLNTFNGFDFLYSGAFWEWPLPIYLLFIQIHSLHPDLQGLDKLTLHIQTYFMASPPAIAILPIVVIIETNHDLESQCLLQMQLEIWDSCFILFICYRPKD
jgi:hypothetical protein